MAVNDKQKITIIDNNAAIKTTIDAKLLEGYVILFMLNLAPVQNKILIIYATPEVI